MLEQAECRSPQRAEVLVSVSLADSALVLAKGHIKLPVQTVLDPPVAANRTGELCAINLFVQDEVSHSDLICFASFGVVDRNANRRQVLPPRRIRKVRWNRANIITAFVNSAVSGLLAVVELLSIVVF